MLRRFDETRKREDAEFPLRQDKLDEANSAARVAYVGEPKTATALVEARKAYRSAGGED